IPVPWSEQLPPRYVENTRDDPSSERADTKASPSVGPPVERPGGGAILLQVGLERIGGYREIFGCRITGYKSVGVNVEGNSVRGVPARAAKERRVNQRAPICGDLRHERVILSHHLLLNSTRRDWKIGRARATRDEGTPFTVNRDSSWMIGIAAAQIRGINHALTVGTPSRDKPVHGQLRTDK